MVRPHKQGLEYFPLDVDADQEGSIQYLEAKHGPVAFAVWVKLLMRVYREGYLLQWGDHERYVFARQIGVDATLVQAIVDDAVAEGLFDAPIYAAHNVLTSRGIQVRYMEASKRRAAVRMVREYLPDLDIVSSYPHVAVVNANNNGVTVDVGCAETPQSRVKESRVEKGSACAADQDKPEGKERTGTYALPACMEQPLRISAPEPYKGTCAGFVGEAITARYGLVGPSDMNLLAQAITDGCLEGCKGENAAACAVHLVGKMAKAAPTVRQSTLMLHCWRNDRYEVMK